MGELFTVSRNWLTLDGRPPLGTARLQMSKDQNTGNKKIRWRHSSAVLLRHWLQNKHWNHIFCPLGLQVVPWNSRFICNSLFFYAIHKICALWNQGKNVWYVFCVTFLHAFSNFFYLKLIFISFFILAAPHSM